MAARYTFRRLFLAGLTALLTNVVGFAVLMVIDIPVIRDLALTTSLGVSVLIFTKLILIPVLLSYIGVSDAAAARSVRAERRPARLAARLGALLALLATGAGRWRATRRRRRCGAAGRGGFAVSLQLKIGDLDPGAPELRADSRYNRDVAYVNAHYGLSSDQFVVMRGDAARTQCKQLRDAGRGRPPGRRRCGRSTASRRPPRLADMVR